ncbi:LamG domain-containing protein [Streptomyces sp. AK02-01A]|uniref:LamG domain-containing protein n=1 Tax=Streptomyces sp. AK02-01A TaxID=3028648 RepID=UPI0039F6CD1C
MIRLGEKNRFFSLDWPGSLPEPTLDGATATYPDVLPGVDLKLTATAEGYRQTLAVKTAQAAASPELEQITFTAMAKGLEVVPGAGGGLRAVDEDGNAVFNGPAGQMWDSAGDETSRQRSARATATEDQPIAGGQGGQGDPALPGDGDTTAVLPVRVTDGAVTVRPDLGLLRGDKTVYPVFIDPPVGLGASERTKISSDGDRFWQFDGDLGVGLCGSADGYYCGPGYTDRMLFEFAPTKLSGKYVIDATFRAYETWSFNCDAKWLNLVRTNNISEATKWPGPATIDHMGDRLVSAGRGKNCSPEQPASWVEFHDDPAQPEENLTPTVRSFADGKISRLTFMLWAKDEDDPRAWKRFDDNAELQVTYVPLPGVPTDVGLIPGDGTTAYCRASESDPLIVTRLDPMVQARVQTKVQPAGGEEKGSLQAGFLVENKHPDGVWATAWSDARPQGTGWDPDGTLEKVRTNDRGDGGVYRYKSRTRSHWAYNGKSGDLYSSYSPWCYFKVDSTAPKVPTITAGMPYKQCVADLCDGEGGPGIPGSFTFTPNAADKDISGYRWRLLTTTAANTKVVTGSTYTELNVVPPLAGTQVLSVEAKDVRNRWGPPAEFTFKVAPAEGAVGRWHFDDGVANSGVTTAADSATAGTRHNATLFAAGAGWSTMARRGEADQSLWLNDTANASQQTGYAATSGPAVNTRDSFTVSTWAYLTDASDSRVVLAEYSATNGQALSLSYSPGDKKWGFSRAATDTSSPVWIRSAAEQASPPLNAWTHLAGVFDTHGDTDKTNDTIQLFINGRPQGQPVRAAGVTPAYEPWTATGGLIFGRSPGGQFFHGRIDETAVWQRALTPEEIRQETRSEEDSLPGNELVAQWDATTATGTEIAEATSYPRPAMTLSATGAVLNEDDSALVLDGATGYAAAAGPVIDETGSFTVSALVQLSSQKLAAKPAGYLAQVAGQRAGGASSWALWVTKPADDIYQWKLTRTATGSDGEVTQSAVVLGGELAEMDTWVQVTGVFDAQEGWEWTDPADPTNTETRNGKLHLYVGQAEQPAGAQADFSAVQQGDGELAVGRGAAEGSVGHYLPGSLDNLRIWTGAMSAEQVRSQVLADPNTG